MLEFLKLWQDEELLLLASHAVIVGHRTQVVVIAVVCAVCGGAIGSIHQVDDVAFVLCADLSTLQGVDDAVMDRDLAVREAHDGDDLHVLVVL